MLHSALALHGGFLVGHRLPARGEHDQVVPQSAAIGAGGVLVELLADSVTVVPPIDVESVARVVMAGRSKLPPVVSQLQP